MSNWSPHAFSTCSDNNALITDTQSHNGPNGHATHKLDVKEQEMKQKRMNQKKNEKHIRKKRQWKIETASSIASWWICANEPVSHL